MSSQPDAPTEQGQGFTTAGELMQQCMAELRLDADFPLVLRGDTVRNLGQAFTFLDYPQGRPGRALQYGPFYVKDMADGMQWIAHLSEKGWVTVKHLRIFSERLLDSFAQGRR